MPPKESQKSGTGVQKSKKGGGSMLFMDMEESDSGSGRILTQGQLQV